MAPSRSGRDEPARIVIATDKFAGTLSARDAAEAICTGWLESRPNDTLDAVPMADGGPGFVDVLTSAVGGELVTTSVRGPLGDSTLATFLLAGATAYVESAQACGIEITGGRNGEKASTFGVGELIAAATAMGATQVFVGAGGTGSNDGGAGMLAALGASADCPLDQGTAGLVAMTTFRPPSKTALPALILVSDVDNPLIGGAGATFMFGPQKGISDPDLDHWDDVLARYGSLVAPHLVTHSGAGAAGGLGFGLMSAGAHRVSGTDYVANAVGLATRIAGADLVITGEGSFDASSVGGKVPVGVAQRANAAGVDCIALAGRVTIQDGDRNAAGISAAYSLIDFVGPHRAFAEPKDSLRALAARVASVWPEIPPNPSTPSVPNPSTPVAE